jgi:hypothetical protein
VNNLLSVEMWSKEMARTFNSERRSPIFKGWKAAARKDKAEREAKAVELRRGIRKFLDQRGYKGEERRQWWAELRRLAKAEHGIEL